MPRSRRQVEAVSRRAGQQTIVDAIRDELLLPLLPEIATVLRRTLKGKGVRDIDVALVLIKVASDVAGKESVQDQTLNELLHKYVEHATKPGGEGVPDFFSDVRKGDDTDRSAAGINNGSGTPAAQDHLGATG